MTVCGRCGRDSPDDARFCAACGASLAETPPREERKVVSVLFADLVDFTSRAERMDPEDVRAMLSPYYERLRTDLERHGGTVEKFIGDAVVALFGAPVAHEDDPERAVRAALTIREAIGELNEADPSLDLHRRRGEHRLPGLLALADAAVRTPWIDAGRAVAAGDLQAAADILEGIGSRSEEAFARLMAGERLSAEGRRDKAEAQLGEPMAFHRLVNATAYVARAEALLRSTA